MAKLKEIIEVAKKIEPVIKKDSIEDYLGESKLLKEAFDILGKHGFGTFSKDVNDLKVTFAYWNDSYQVIYIESIEMHISPENGGTFKRSEYGQFEFNKEFYKGVEFPYFQGCGEEILLQQLRSNLEHDTIPNIMCEIIEKYIVSKNKTVYDVDDARRKMKCNIERGNEYVKQLKMNIARYLGSLENIMKLYPVLEKQKFEEENFSFGNDLNLEFVARGGAVKIRVSELPVHLNYGDGYGEIVVTKEADSFHVEIVDFAAAKSGLVGCRILKQFEEKLNYTTIPDIVMGLLYKG